MIYQDVFRVGVYNSISGLNDEVGANEREATNLVEDVCSSTAGAVGIPYDTDYRIKMRKVVWRWIHVCTGFVFVIVIVRYRQSLYLWTSCKLGSIFFQKGLL